MKIRFRVWDGEKMWYPDEDAVIGQYRLGQTGKVLHEVESFDPYFGWDDSGHEAMLSEGIEDENGVEIWAGDICRHSIVGLMSVDSGDFQATRYIFPAFGKTVEVVGNKYENPELLKEVA